jgi:hypothetical protein
MKNRMDLVNPCDSSSSQLIMWVEVSSHQDGLCLTRIQSFVDQRLQHLYMLLLDHSFRR